MIPWLKIAPYGIGLIAIAVILGVVYRKGYNAGSAHIQAQFNAYVVRSDAEVERARIANEATAKAAEARNAGIITAYSDRLNSAVAIGNLLAGKLRDAYAKAGSSPVPEGKGGPATPDAGQTPSDVRITEAVGNALSECNANTEQLDALRDELIPQL